ncbi:MAG: response regulator [Campylobacterota bacterium]|nr:response regulator [Campylobacterota bacterium]
MTDIKKLKELSEGFSVLYVEDDDSIRNSMHVYLKKFFFKVVAAEDGLEGLDLYKKETFDIVITDLSMPRMNGLEMITNLKKINPKQAVLVTSAHSESDYMMGAIKAGIEGYVIKPFDFHQLNQELMKIIENLHLILKNRNYQENLEEMVQKKSDELTKVLAYENENYEQTLYSMVEMIEERDTYTAGHSKRVAEYAKLIAQEMHYTKEECTKIYQAGILHDIGKVATPDTVLLNPKKLNEIEYKLIQEHVSVGYKLLNHVPMFKELSEIVKSHHERYDGTGYPDGLSAEEINPLSQIMIVADAFDAMTTSRIYKARKSLKDAMDELITLSGVQFHPSVVVAAVKALKSIHIDKNISQLPTTVLEQERFAYFYKDTITHAYNPNYLDVVLMKNGFEKEFSFMYIFYLKNFSSFNNDYSWEKGNEFLEKFATLLVKYFSKSLVFRVFGDDFVVLNSSEIDTTLLNEQIEKLLENTELECSYKQIDLQKKELQSVQDIDKM